MMFSILKAYAVLTAIILLVSCTDKPNSPAVNTGTTVTAGQFGLSLLKGLNRLTVEAVAKADTSATVQFDLGKIRSSNTYYFILYNVGQRSITDVAILSDNGNFIVSPENIDSLMPNGRVEMMPIIKVSVVHGTAIEGIGYRTCLPAGENAATLRITGKTKTGVDRDTTLVLTAQLKVQALVVSLDLLFGCAPVALEKPQLWAGGVKLLDGSMGVASPAFGINNPPTRITPGEWAKIINKSNLPIVVYAYYYHSSTAMKYGPISDSLGIGDSLFVRRLFDNSIVICIDGDHSVNNISGMQPQSDGRTYFNIWQVGLVDTTQDCAPGPSSKVIDLGAQ